MINRITVINEMGYFSWYHNLTSFLGWHLYSYPSGYATFIAAFSQVTGLSPIYHDYLFSIFISSFSVILMFVFSKEMLGKNHLALLSMFIFNTFFIYVLYTWDNLASRGVFILFSPVILLTIKLIDRNRNNFARFFILLFIQIVCLVSFHRVFYIFFLSVFITGLITLLINRRYVFQDTKFVYFIFLLTGPTILYQLFSGDIFFRVDRLDFNIRPNDSLTSKIIAFCLFLSRDFSVLMVFAVIGIFLTIVNQRALFWNKFTCLFTLSVPFFLASGNYFFIVLLPLLPLWISFSISYFFSTKFSNNLSVYVPIIILLVVALPVAIWAFSKFYLGFLLIATGILILISTLSPKLRSKKIVYAFVSSAILISSGQVITGIGGLSSEIQSDYYDEDEGPLYLQENLFNNAHWIRVHSVGPSSTFGAENGILLPIASISKNQPVNGHLKQLENPIIWESLDSSFNVTWLLRNQKYLYDYDLTERYSLRDIDVLVFRDGDVPLLVIYDPELLIYSSSFFDQEAAELEYTYFYNICDNSYLIYSSTNQQVRHISD